METTKEHKKSDAQISEEKTKKNRRTNTRGYSKTHAQTNEEKTEKCDTQMAEETAKKK